MHLPFGNECERPLLAATVRNVRNVRNVYGLRRRIGVVFPLPVGLPLSVYDNVALAPRLSGQRNKAELDIIVERCLQRAALWDEVKDRLNESALTLSGGQQQRLCLARALALEPDILLLDEPSNYLDLPAVEWLQRTLRSFEGTLLLITHDLREAIFLADQVVVLSGRPARTQYVLDVPDTGPRDLEHLYTPEAAEMLAVLRHQIEIAQGRAPADAA